MSFRVESAEYAVNYTLADGYEVGYSENTNEAAFAVIFHTAGNYVYELVGNADGDTVTTYFAAGIPIAIKPKKILATGSAAATCTLLFRK